MIYSLWHADREVASSRNFESIGATKRLLGGVIYTEFKGCMFRSEIVVKEFRVIPGGTLTFEVP